MQKLISDLRFFESTKENTDGYFPGYIGKIYLIDEKKLNTVKERFVLKLREKGLCLPDFDHVYINMTPCIESGKISAANRSIDKYHSFYRFMDAGLTEKEFNNLEENEKITGLITIASEAITALNSFSEEEKATIRSCADEILSLGENTEIIYKYKKNEKNCLQVCVKLLDTGMYSPFIRIFDNGKNLIREEVYGKLMKQDEFIFQFAAISLGKNSATIKPKKNAIAEHYQLETLKYTF